MDKLEIINGQVILPKEYELSITKRTLKIRTPWMSSYQRLCKDNFTVVHNTHMRHKSLNEKPYIPEGKIEIDGIMFEVEDKENELPKEQKTLC